MSVTHHATLRNVLADAVLAAIDQDVGAGYIEIQTGASAEVATLALADPAGTVSGPTLTFDTTPDLEDASATGGEAAQFVICDNSGDEQIYGSVGTSGSGADIIMSTTTIAAAAIVRITSLTYTAPV